MTGKLTETELDAVEGVHDLFAHITDKIAKKNKGNVHMATLSKMFDRVSTSAKKDLAAYRAHVAPKPGSGPRG